MAGGEGGGKLLPTTLGLARAGLDFHLVVVTGRNAALKAKLEELAPSLPTPMTVLGFRNDVPELMRAADLLVTKAGPGTIAEASVAEVPVVVYDYVPGQERGNLDYVRTNGIGVVALTTAEVVSSVPRIVHNQERLAKMRSQQTAIAPRGSLAPHRRADRADRDQRPPPHASPPPAEPMSATLTIDVPRDVADEVVATRRDLHRHPELGFEEHRTARARRASACASWASTVHEGIGRTGVVGVLRGTRPGRTIMLRADMDALPIEEENDVAYRCERAARCTRAGTTATSRCCSAPRASSPPARRGGGHGRAFCSSPPRKAKAARRRWSPTACSSASASSARTVCTSRPRIRPDRSACAKARSTRRATRSRSRSKAKAGTARRRTSRSTRSTSPAQFVVAVQQIVSRNIDPIEPAVVTIGAIHGGTTHNVIPSRVRLLGTVRAFDATVRAKMPERIERVLRGVLRGERRDVLLRLPVALPGDDERSGQTRYVRALAERVVGPERVADVPKLMGAEDFSFFAERVPACFFTIGSNGGERSAFPHHHARFDIDESALETGVRMMTALALDAPAHAPYTAVQAGFGRRSITSGQATALRSARPAGALRRGAEDLGAERRRAPRTGAAGGRVGTRSSARHPS